MVLRGTLSHMTSASLRFARRFCVLHSSFLRRGWFTRKMAVWLRFTCLNFSNMSNFKSVIAFGAFTDFLFPWSQFETEFYAGGELPGWYGGG